MMVDQPNQLPQEQLHLTHKPHRLWIINEIMMKIFTQLCRTINETYQEQRLLWQLAMVDQRTIDHNNLFQDVLMVIWNRRERKKALIWWLNWNFDNIFQFFKYFSIFGVLSVQILVQLQAMLELKSLLQNLMSWLRPWIFNFHMHGPWMFVGQKKYNQNNTFGTFLIFKSNFIELFRFSCIIYFNQRLKRIWKMFHG